MSAPLLLKRIYLRAYHGSWDVRAGEAAMPSLFTVLGNTTPLPVATTSAPAAVQEFPPSQFLHSSS